MSRGYKYNKDNYDLLQFRVRKGTKEIFKAIAKEKEISMANLFMRMVRNERNSIHSNADTDVSDNIYDDDSNG
jgi:hypothetical protein